MKIDIFKVILANFIGEKHQSMVYFSVNIHWTSTLSIFLNKSYFFGDILEFQNVIIIPATLKLQASDNGLAVKIFYQNAPKSSKVLEIRAILEL